MLVALHVIKHPGHEPAGQTKVADAVAGAGPQSAAALNLPERRIYPYSVIAGGVESPQDLRNAIAHDPEVAQLYVDFDFSHARIERLTTDREVYVAYRYDNQIYWTKKRLLLRAGETVITDGKETGRTRCGNRVSETPMQPVRPDEPPNAAANAPIEVAANGSVLPALPMESPYVDPSGNGLAWSPSLTASTPVSLNPPAFYPWVPGGPSSFPNVTPPPPPVTTPEPSALLLLALGFAALGATEILKIREPRKD